MLKIHLKKLLFDRDMTRADLQRLTGIRYDTLSAYYHGFIKRINTEDLIKICDVLECSLNELIEYLPENKNAQG